MLRACCNLAGDWAVHVADLPAGTAAPSSAVAQPSCCHAVLWRQAAGAPAARSLATEGAGSGRDAGAPEGVAVRPWRGRHQQAFHVLPDTFGLFSVPPLFSLFELGSSTAAAAGGGQVTRALLLVSVALAADELQVRTLPNVLLLPPTLCRGAVRLLRQRDPLHTQHSVTAQPLTVATNVRACARRARA